MNIFRTRLDFFGNVPGYIIMEFPLMHGITALLYHLFGVREIIGRLVSVAFSIGSMFLMYGLARQFLSVAGAFAALILYVFSPMNIFFSRAFMPESSMMFFMIGAVYFLLKWLNRPIFFLYLLAIIFATCTGLAKPTAGIIFVPIFTIWFLKYKWHLFKRFDFWLYISVSLIPSILWCTYANYFNSRHPMPFGFDESWVKILTSRGIVRHWFNFKFYAFIGGSFFFLLLTPLGFIGSVIGILCVKAGNQRKILYSWLGILIIYFYILAGPNSGHIYYHLALLPLSAIFFGFTVEWLWSNQKFIKERLKRKLPVWLWIAFIFLVLISYGVGYFQYFKYMYSNRMPYVMEISEIIKKNVPEKGRFIIDNESGLLTSVISYYSHSRAQPFTVSERSIVELENLRAQGATTFVTMETKYGSSIQRTEEHSGFWHYLNKNYKPLALTDHYHIFDLRASVNY